MAKKHLENYIRGLTSKKLKFESGAARSRAITLILKNV